MQIFRRCPIHGKIKSMEIDVTHEQIKAWKEGELIQDAMPHLSVDDREFVMTGITPDVWEANFGEE